MLIIQIIRRTLHRIFKKVLTLQAAIKQAIQIKLQIQHCTVKMRLHKIVLIQFLHLTIQVIYKIIHTITLLTMIFIDSTTAVHIKVYCAYISSQTNTNL